MHNCSRAWARAARPGGEPKLALLAAIVLLLVILSACATAAGPTGKDGDSGEEGAVEPDLVLATAPNVLRVVATTTIVGDIVARVGGDRIELTVMLPPGADPHGFEPTPRDVAAVADADVVFVNGLGLETFLEPMLENAGGTARLVSMSEGIETHQFSNRDASNEDGAAIHEHDVDPHVWFDPRNVAVWADNAATALGSLDPGGADRYVANAKTLKVELAALDDWTHDQVALIPTDRRRLVTDHDTLGYLAQRYGFDRVGTLHGFSTMSEPSAAELARLEDTILALSVPAIFVGTTVNPDLAKRLAEDTGTHVVVLFTGSLSEPGGPAASYEAFMRYNVSAIVRALTNSPPDTEKR